MKKIAIFFIIIIAIISTVAYIYLNQIATNRQLQKENAQFNIKQDQEMTGQDLATILNRVLDTNEKNKILQDKNGNYIENSENSIKMDITFTDIDVTYNIERIGQAGIANFVQNYRGIIFKCNEVQYHKATGKIKYMKFEQITE